MPAPHYEFTSERLGFRRYRASDVDLLRPVFADADAARFYPAMGQQESLERWINWNLKNYADFGFGLWAVELLANGLFLGDAGITYQTVEGQRVLEIGWHIHPQHRCRGYATEAGQACLQYGFGVLRAAELSSIVDPANTASMKVAARVHTAMRHFQGKTGDDMLLYFTQAPAATPAPA